MKKIFSFVPFLFRWRAYQHFQYQYAFPSRSLGTRGVVTSVLLILMLNSCEKKDPSLIEYLFSASNPQMSALDFNASEATCPKCRMGVVHKHNAAQVIFGDEKTYVFDDVGCMILWVEQVGANFNTLKSFVYSTDSKEWIDATQAFYSIKDTTPMGYGFGGYEKSQKGYIDFDTMRLKMLRGENMADPKIRKMLLGQ